MDSDMRASPQDGADPKIAFRKPANDATNRKYRRRSPVNESSSSDESPKRGYGNSPVRSRDDLAKFPDDRRGINDGKSFARDSGRSHYSRSGDWHRRSDHHRSSRSSYHRHDDYVGSEKDVDDCERENMKSTSRSGREKSSVDCKTYNKDKDLSSDRAGSGRMQANHNAEDVRSIERDKYKGDEDGHDRNRAYHKGDRDIRNEKRDFYKGDRNGRDGRTDYYKGDRDDRSDKREYYKVVRDGHDEKREYYKGGRERDCRNEKGDSYKGNKDGRDERRDYYKEHRDDRDEKRDQRNFGVYRTHHSPSYEEGKGHHNSMDSRRDGSVHHLKESSRNDMKEMDYKKCTKEERKKHDGQETKSLKEQYSRESEALVEDKFASNHKDQESPAKKPKLFSLEGSSDHVGNVSKFVTVPGASVAIASNQDQDSAGKVTSEQSFVKDSDIDAAKVAALKAAELVNRNLIGTGYLSTDQKKRLLWGNKKSTVAEESAHHWDAAIFSDRERQEKFNKLMGVKGEVKVELKSNHQDASGLFQSEKQKELQLDLEKQYTAGLRRRDGRTVGLGL